MKEIDNIFGERTWLDVRREVLRVIARRWRGMQLHDVEDAVSDAMLDLVDYWVQLGSSVTTDTDRNYAYAIRRGIWRANERLVKLMNERDGSVSLEHLGAIEAGDTGFISGLATEPFAESFTSHTPHGMQESAEDTLFAQVEHDMVLDIVESLGEEEFDRWFADFWSGDSLADIAERRGEQLETVRRRRLRGLARLARDHAA